MNVIHNAGSKYRPPGDELSQGMSIYRFSRGGFGASCQNPVIMPHWQECIYIYTCIWNRFCVAILTILHTDFGSCKCPFGAFPH